MNNNPAIKYLPDRQANNELWELNTRIGDLRRQMDPDHPISLLLSCAEENLDEAHEVMWIRLNEQEGGE